MSPRVLSFTSNSILGNRVLSGVGFQPSYLEVTVSQKNSTVEPFIHESKGAGDGTTQTCSSTFWDGAGETRSFTDRVINHMTRVNGNLTNSITASLVSLDSDGFTLNFTANIPGYRITVRAFP